MQRYLQSIADGELWFLTTAKGEPRDTIARIQKRISRLQHERDFYAYSAWCFETRPELHAHILFVGDSAVVERLNRSAFGPSITIKPVDKFQRGQRDLTQRQLAALAGRSQSQLSNALRGHDPISAAVVNRLRDALLA